jgi:FkbM family methyltransferase
MKKLYRRFFPYILRKWIGYLRIRTRSIIKGFMMDLDTHPFKFIKDVVFDYDLLFIDIGANKGQSIEAAHKYFRQLIYVIAYEPVKNNELDSLMTNYKAKNSRIVYDVFNKAVGCKDSVDINITDHSGLNSVYQINKDYNYLFSSGETNDKINVSCESLDNIIKNIRYSNIYTSNAKQVTVLKIDVQGFEYNVLESGPSLSNGLVDFIFIEIILINKYVGQKTYTDLLQLLINYGFVLLDFRPFLKQNKNQLLYGNSFGQYTEADVIYVHKDAIDRLNLELYTA